MKPQFKIKRSKKNGQFYFALKAKNGKVICQSEGYKTRAGCVKGIDSVKKNAGEAVIG